MMFATRSSRAFVRFATVSSRSIRPQLQQRNFATYYTPAHEYIKVDEKTMIGTCGITDYAQDSLGEIVFVELPEVGDDFDKGGSYGGVESVKAASDVYAPVSGEVVEVNEKLSESPEMVNSDAEGDAWFIKMQIANKDELDGLMDDTKYAEHCAKEKESGK